MRNMINNKKLQINIVTLILLCLGLCIASFAAASMMIRYDVKDNFFQTGGIDIDLNGDKPIIPACLIEPGVPVEKEFYIKNNGSWEVFYKLYFEEVKGELADVLEITIYEKDSPEIVLLEGKINDLVHADRLDIAGELERGQTQELIARFHLPEDAGNEYKDKSLEFKMSAIAVQTKNNDPEDPKFE